MITFDLKNKKLILLIVLSVAAFFSLLYGIVTPSSVKRQAVTANELEPGGALPVADKVALFERTARRTDYVSWGRNPFMLKEAAVSVKRFKLNGIAWDPVSPRAVINDQIVGIGDKIDGNTVVEIKTDRVILNDGLNDFELR